MVEQEKPQEESQLVNLQKVVGSKDTPAFYANAVHIMVSVYDFTVVLGQVGFAADGTPEMREAARLNLSPQHAKALASVLAKRVSDYERQFGRISLEPVGGDTGDGEASESAASEPEQPS